MGSARWFRLGLGLLLVIVPSWVLLSRLDAIWNGHPAYPATLLVAIGAGLTLIAFVFLPWRLEQEPDGLPWEIDDLEQRPAPVRTRHRGWRLTGRVRPRCHRRRAGRISGLAAAIPGGFGCHRRRWTSDAAVTVIDNPTTIVLRPVVAVTPTVGLVFSPGARVDSRAYVDLLRPAAEAGYLVVILKEPYGLAIIQTGQSGCADRRPSGDRELGGRRAFPRRHRRRPVRRRQSRHRQGVCCSGRHIRATICPPPTRCRSPSISGSNDLLATPADIEASKAKLPPETIFVQIKGGVHAFFGDYGEQPGDGQPEIDRATAAAQISAATVTFLKGLQ